MYCAIGDVTREYLYHQTLIPISGSFLTSWLHGFQDFAELRATIRSPIALTFHPHQSRIVTSCNVLYQIFW